MVGVARRAGDPPGTSKRPRVADVSDTDEGDDAADVTAFKVGNIKKVTVHNFMTYADCTFDLGSRLNLILGPNGSGKSSFVCALCIGLAASPKVLGRADSVKEFVKRGEERAWVEIEVHQAPDEGVRAFGGTVRDTVRIRRVLSRDTNSSTWFLNGRDSGLREIQKLTKKLNIQINNLCQFLPQDRVVEFAKMSPEELLVETERAISLTEDDETSLYGLHEKLKACHTEVETLAQTIETHKSNLAELTERKGDIEKEMDKYRKKRKVEDEKAWVDSKIVWAQYEAEKQEYVRAKTALNTAKKAATAKENKAKKVMRPREEEEQRIAEFAEASKASTKAYEDVSKVFHAKMTKSEKLISEVEKVENRLADWETDKATHANKVAILERDVAAFRSELKDWEGRQASGYNTFTREDQKRLNEVRDQLKDLEVQEQDVKEGLHKLRVDIYRERTRQDHLKQELSYSTDSRTQKIMALTQAFPGKCKHLFAIRNWIDQNEASLRGPVYGPILAEVTLHRPDFAPFLENQVPNYVWWSFVPTYESDRDVLMRNLRQYQASILYTTSSAREGPLDHPDGDAQMYEAMDIRDTLDMVFEAPSAVKHVMKDLAAINRAYVGSNVTQTQINDAASRNIEPQWRTTCISRLWTPDNCYTKTTSSYDNYQSLKTTNVRPARLFKHASKDAANDKRLADMKKHLHKSEVALRTFEMQRKDTEAKSAILGHDIESLKQEKKRLVHKKQEVKYSIADLQNKIRLGERELRRLAENTFTEAAEEGLKEARREAIKKQIAMVVAAATQYGAVSDAHFSSVTPALHHQRARFALQEKQHALRVAENECQQARDLVQKAEKVYEKEKAKLTKSKEQAEHKCPLTDEAKAHFVKLPSDLDALYTKSAELEAKLSTMISNKAVLKEHQDVLAKIAQLESTIEDEQAMYEGRTNSEEGLRQQWEPPLRKLTARVNEKFGHLMMELGYAGECRLQEAERYEHWRMELHVKYSDAHPLSLLTSNQQSGGERSVATVLFLLALQASASTSAFRVIDEINQGMDERNEREVFKQLVKEGSSKGSQCFLLTPKLLGDLHYDDKVVIHNIFNGPGLKTWSSQRLWM